MQAKLQLVPIGQLAKFAGKKVRDAVACRHDSGPAPLYCAQQHCADTMSAQLSSVQTIHKHQKLLEPQPHDVKGVAEAAQCCFHGSDICSFPQPGLPCLAYYTCCCVQGCATSTVTASTLSIPFCQSHAQRAVHCALPTS